MNAFIIHSNSDKDRVNANVNKISKEVNGFNPLVLVNGGQFWKTEAKGKIKKAQAVIFFVGASTHKSKYVGWELKQAIKHDKQIFIINIKNSFKLHSVLERKDSFSSKTNYFGKIVTIEKFITIANNHLNDEYSLFNDCNEALLIEQYKLFLETSETLVERRQKVSNFYILANTVLISITGTVISLNIDSMYIWILCGLLSFVGIIFAISWIKTVESYGNLNSSKMKIISMIEKRLPASLFDTEWEVLSDKLNTKSYVSFTDNEKSVPKMFLFLYSVIIVGIIIFFLVKIQT